MNSTTKKSSLDLKGFVKKQYYYLILVMALLAICLIMSFVNSNFMTLTNVISMLEQMAEYALMALGIMLCITAGGIDLSTMGVANLVAALAALTMLRFLPDDISTGKLVIGTLLIFVGSIVLGLLCGLLNGTLITKLGIPPMLATMSSNYVYTGICMVLTKGASLSGINQAFVSFVNFKVFDVIPLSAIVFVICAIVFGYLMNKAPYGTRLCMVGTNPKATRMAGLKNDKIIIRTYMTCATMSALAGFIMLGRLSSARADYGKSYSTQAILIVILGGTDPVGGRAKVLGAVIASFIIQAVTTAIAMTPGANSYIKNVVFAVLLLGIMIYDWTRVNKKKR